LLLFYLIFFIHLNHLHNIVPILTYYIRIELLEFSFFLPLKRFDLLLIIETFSIRIKLNGYHVITIPDHLKTPIQI
jgi:hypothetical protein